MKTTLWSALVWTVLLVGCALDQDQPIPNEQAPYSAPSVSENAEHPFELRRSTTNPEVGIVVPVGTSADVTPNNIVALRKFISNGGNAWKIITSASSFSDGKMYWHVQNLLKARGLERQLELTTATK